MLGQTNLAAGETTVPTQPNYVPTQPNYPPTPTNHQVTSANYTPIRSHNQEQNNAGNNLQQDIRGMLAQNPNVQLTP